MTKAPSSIRNLTSVTVVGGFIGNTAEPFGQTTVIEPEYVSVILTFNQATAWLSTSNSPDNVTLPVSVSVPTQPPECSTPNQSTVPLPLICNSGSVIVLT